MEGEANNSSTSENAKHRVFATTSWSMVLQAANAEGNDGSEVSHALSELCQQYWFPLYSFVRRKGFDQSEAEDLTQSFFAELLEKDRLEFADPKRGRFRSFLLTSLNNFISNQWRADNAIKRGAGQSILSIDYTDAEDRYTNQPTDELTAEQIFERNWALSILQQAITAVGEQYEKSGKGELFQSLKGFLTGEDKLAYSTLATQTGMKEGAIKVAVHRLRQRYGQQLRLQISKTVKDPSEVDTELQSLFDALG